MFINPTCDKFLSKTELLKLYTIDDLSRGLTFDTHNLIGILKNLTVLNSSQDNKGLMNYESTYIGEFISLIDDN